MPVLCDAVATVYRHVPSVVMGPGVRRDDGDRVRFNFQTAMTWQDSAFSRRHAPEFCKNSRTFEKSRAQGMPDARCTRSLACNKRRNARALTRSTEITRHSLRNGFNSSSVVALVYRAC